MGGLLQTLRGLGMVRLGVLGGVGAALIGFFLFLSARLSQPDMALLYADLEPADSSQIVSKLEQLNVPYQLVGDGSQIMVPRDQAARLRMTMAEDGLPSGGSIGYEIFDRGDTLGASSFEQQVNRLRALEGELSRTIRSVSPIKGARVHLVLPERQLFSQEKQQPSASIILTMDRGAALDPGQVVAIQHLVAAAVPGLKPSAISIVDNWGTLLARGSDGGDAMAGENAENQRIAYEKRMTRAVEELLQRSLGYGKVRAEVSAEMDFDRITTNSEEYNPDSQVVRSTQTVEEKADSSEGRSRSDAGVSVSSNLPQPGGGQNDDSKSASQSARTEETVNYEISKTVQTHVRESGVLKRLSVAVLVDGTYATAADGTVTYTPRPPEELEQIAKLVRSAVGFDEKRGDTVEVVNMRFAAEDAGAAADATEDPNLLMGFERSGVLRIAEIVIVGILALLILLLVVRPMLTKMLAAAPAADLSRTPLLTGPAGSAMPALTAAGDAGAPTAQRAIAAPGLADEIEQMIDVNQVEGRVRASSLRKISEIVEKHPEEAVGILRNWMYAEPS